MPTATKPLTFDELAKLDDRIKTLEHHARDCAIMKARRERSCGNTLWLTRLKGAVAELVGPLRRPSHPILSTPAALETVTAHLRQLMPRCPRKCRCVNWARVA